MSHVLEISEHIFGFVRELFCAEKKYLETNLFVLGKQVFQIRIGNVEVIFASWIFSCSFEQFSSSLQAFCSSHETYVMNPSQSGLDDLCVFQTHLKYFLHFLIVAFSLETILFRNLMRNSFFFFDHKYFFEIRLCQMNQHFNCRKSIYSESSRRALFLYQVFLNFRKFIWCFKIRKRMIYKFPYPKKNYK